MNASRKTCLYGCLMAALATPLMTPAVIAQSSAPAAATRHAFDIPAGPLGQVLDAFARQAHIRLDIDPALVSNQHSNGLHASMTIAAGLDAVLAPSGLAARDDDNMHYRIVRRGIAQTGIDDADMNGATELARMMVYGTAYDPLDVGYYLNTRSIDRTKNADLADAVKQIPTVRLDPTANNSMRQGDLLPTEFSISGGATYQNRIEIGGATTDNLIDPGNRSSQMDPSRVNGNSQGIFVDTAFLDQLQVLDSNIGAAQGGFTGGVVKSEIRGYRGKSEASASWRTSRDAWTTFHVDPSQREQFQAGNGNPMLADTNSPYQPSFRKDFYRLQGATRWADIGVFAGFSRRRSRIEQRQFSPPVIAVKDGEVAWTYPDLSPKRPITRTSDFGALKFSLLDRAYELNLGITYSHYEGEGFIPYYQDSDFSEKHGGLGITLDYSGEVGPFQATGLLSLQDASDARGDNHSTLRHYYGRPSLWDGDVIWGSYGPLTTRQRSYQAKGSLSHTWGEDTDSRTDITFGVELNHLRFKRHRPRPLNIYYYSCRDPDNYYCPIADQYNEEHNLYPAGSRHFTSTDYAAWGQWSWHGKHWSHRLGLRYDRDGWLHNRNVAPRWLSALDITGDGSAVVQLGLNRYYGKSFLAYRIQSQDRAGAITETRSRPDQRFTSRPMTSRYLPLQGLATPYDDEIALNWRQLVLGQYVTLGFLERWGRHQVTSEYLDDTDQYRYTNGASSRTRMVTLAMEPAHPFHWLAADWRYNLSASWERRESNQITAVSSGAVPYDAVANTGDILFEGRVTSWRDLPTSDFATPKTLSVVMLTNWKSLGLTWRNDLYWRDSYRALVGEGVVPDPRDADAPPLRAYHRHRYASGFNWDTGLKYQFAWNKHADIYINIDVLNILDREIVLRADDAVPLYQAGRQYWLEVGFDL